MHPRITVISRDEILISLFGKTSLNPYEGGHAHALDVMFQRVEDKLSQCDGNQTIILDCWNGFSSERKRIIKKLGDYGAQQIICWYFVTPLEFCIKWFKDKADTEYWSEHSVAHDWRLYHSEARTIEDDGFDGVIPVNPTQLSLKL